MFDPLGKTQKNLKVWGEGVSIHPSLPFPMRPRVKQPQVKLEIWTLQLFWIKITFNL